MNDTEGILSSEAETLRRAADLVELGGTVRVDPRLLAALLRGLAEDAEQVGVDWRALDLAVAVNAPVPVGRCRVGCRTRGDGVVRCARYEGHAMPHRDGAEGSLGWADDAMGLVPDVLAGLRPERAVLVEFKDGLDERPVRLEYDDPGRVRSVRCTGWVRVEMVEGAA